jgi:hypothetical protein
MKRGIALALAAFLTSGVFAAGSDAARVLPFSAKPMGMSYELWVVHWLRAALKRNPAAPTALFTLSGGKCGFAYGKMWLLPDTLRPAHLSSSCVIPRGKFVFVPVGYLFGPATRKNLETRGVVTRRVLRSTLLMVDGRLLGRGRFVSTPVFNANLPFHNAVDVPPAAGAGT